MKYTGVVIEESLEDKRVLASVTIVKTTVEQVTEKHKTPWISQWTLHTAEIPEEQIHTVAETISESLDTKHSWYADFKNDAFHYVIFSRKVFKVDITQPIQYKDVKKYGASLGIPEYQLNFAPEDTA